MPRINSAGIIGAGIGGGIVSIWKPADPQPVAVAINAGGAVWLDATRLVYQHGAEIETFDTRNGEVQTVDPQGCFELAAGGGVYAAKFTDGVRISNQPGVRFVGAGVGDVGPDGDVMLKQANGTFHNTGRVLVSIQALGNGEWSALDEQYRPICSAGVPNVVPVPGRIYGLRRCGPYALYHAEDGGRVIVQQISQTVGCVVVGGVPAAYRPDLAIVGDRILVTFATSEGEPPESLRRFSVSLAALTETLGPMQTVPPPPPPPEHSTPETVPMPTIPQDEQDRAKAMLAQVRAETGFGAGKDDLPYVTLTAQRLGGRWGLNGKRGDPNNRSHDILAWKVDGGQPILVDVLGDGGGANTPQFGILEYPQPAGAVWIDPGPAPAGTPSQPPPPPQPPPPVVDLSDIIRKLAILEAKVAVLELKPDPVIPPAPDLSQYAKKGDKVSVTGRVNFFGTNHWGGTIDI